MQAVLNVNNAGSARWEARMYVLACTVLAVITTWLAVQISYTQKRFSTGLAGKDKGENNGMVCLWSSHTYCSECILAG